MNVEDPTGCGQMLAKDLLPPQAPRYFPRYEHPMQDIFRGTLAESKRLCAAPRAQRETIVEEYLKRHGDEFMKVLAPWRGPYITKAGQEYYYNVETKESTWDSPLEDAQYFLAVMHSLLAPLAEPPVFHESPTGPSSSREPKLPASPRWDPSLCTSIASSLCTSICAVLEDAIKPFVFSEQTPAVPATKIIPVDMVPQKQLTLPPKLSASQNIKALLAKSESLSKLRRPPPPSVNAAPRCQW
eukprot:GEMP01072886.1.p1 GENE.GEMP01072886.1~~GEMP01072886.1.p1  ORF type:complete len:242 (+),score=50.58 GEMP01072886.1:170-895(+)